MILKDIEQQVTENKQGDWIFPQYDGFCFSNIPDTICYLFDSGKTTPLSEILRNAGITPSNRQKVVAILLDAFGWDQWMRYFDKFEFLKRLTEKGTLIPLTSIFPSVTPVALTTIYSGLTPQQHGLVDASVYLDEIDRIISTIRFRPDGGNEQDQLLKEGVSPRILFDDTTLFEILSESGVPSFTLIHESISNTAFGSVTMKGSQVAGYQGISGLAEILRSHVTCTPSPAYIYAYYGIIDIVCHNYGVYSENYLSEIEPLLTALQTDFIARIPGDVAENTVLLVFADHGHINFDHTETIYLDDFPELVKNLRIGLSGEKILPWGGPRNVLLAIEEAKLDETVAYLREKLIGVAKVYRSKDALRQGFFGTGDIHPRFRSRIGDILLLPENNLTLSYRKPYYRELTLFGMHGGLSLNEMLIPFAVARISDLQ